MKIKEKRGDDELHVEGWWGVHKVVKDWRKTLEPPVVEDRVVGFSANLEP